MGGEGPAAIESVADTAIWVATYRARETERPDALFRDPFARRLVGERGERIVAELPSGNEDEWAFVVRTHLFDRLVEEHVRDGVDTVVNLAAGLDARPYRMDLPPALRWVEVDLPHVLAHKEEAFAGESPVCAVERVPLDLADVDARRELLALVAGGAGRALVLSEGLLIYLSEEAAGSLARDLAAVPSVEGWALDLVSPLLLRMLRRSWGARLAAADAPLVFGPRHGPRFFAAQGWRVLAAMSVVHAAVRLGRAPLLPRLVARLPEGRLSRRLLPWHGVCLLGRPV